MWLGKTLDARGPTGHLWTFPRRRSGRVASPVRKNRLTRDGSTIDLRHETPSPASSCNHLRVFPGKACRCLHRYATTYALLLEKCVDACICFLHFTPFLEASAAKDVFAMIRWCGGNLGAIRRPAVPGTLHQQSRRGRKGRGVFKGAEPHQIILRGCGALLPNTQWPARRVLRAGSRLTTHN